ncbi:MAG: acyl-CoA dehydrogenase [Rhodothermia bacterium]|nr:MAG: acyl-CoA dehydrogenase [Rhodothermia bacterium]
MNLPFYNFLSMLPVWAAVLAIILVLFTAGYTGVGVRVWILLIALVMYGFGAGSWAWTVLGVFAFIFGLPPVRRVVSRGLIGLIEKMKFMPSISQTEQEAIDAGTVWVEGELISGKPDFKRMMEEDFPGLTVEEQEFLDGPAEELCNVVRDWDVFLRKDLPPEAWEVMKKHRFFGMIIPQEYGGLGFSASANSAVVGKVSATNTVLGITVMVPNSLGPAELLIHYGTKAQKDYYLPRLARHEDIPAFALTEPSAGSDAGAIQSTGVVFRGEDGQLYLRLNWEKRYITLVSVATVLGLAFKMTDPENLLGKGTDLGITCALIKTDTPGVEAGRRHDPMGIPFHNGPTIGRDVVVPLEEAIIGGIDGAGKGWGMLMESLAAGRGISLPAVSTFSSKMVARVAGAHAVVRKQFGLSIGKFEGIEEPLARIGAFTYIMDAARRYTNGILNKGGKPAVVTAIMKYNTTELFRKAILDGMDILGGNAISRGPRNVLAHAYINTPIAITVEGANILTRTLMIFGQGAIRSHPFVLKEINALRDRDVRAFDTSFWGHVGMVVRNFFRLIGLTLTRGRLASAPVGGPTSKYFRKLAWVSAKFSFWADLSMFSLGGDLKRKEKLTGRFADIFSWMFLAVATLRRFEADGRPTEDLPLVRWSMSYAFSEIQASFEQIYANLKIPGLTWLMRGPLGLISRMNRISSRPDDRTGHQVAVILQTPGPQRDRLTSGIHLPVENDWPVSRLDHAMELSVAAEPIVSLVRKAARSRTIQRGTLEDMMNEAVEKQLISSEDAQQVKNAEIARNDTIQVDSFTLEEYGLNAVIPDREPAWGDDEVTAESSAVHGSS